MNFNAAAEAGGLFSAAATPVEDQTNVQEGNKVGDFWLRWMINGFVEIKKVEQLFSPFLERGFL
jgi:hypothetical protein